MPPGLAPSRAQAAPTACRARCGACCIAPSIASPIPGMPHGKPAGVRCVQLDEADRCRLFGRPERPAFCVSLQPQPDMCGRDRAHALALLDAMEAATAPSPAQAGGSARYSSFSRT